MAYDRLDDEPTLVGLKYIVPLSSNSTSAGSCEPYDTISYTHAPLRQRSVATSYWVRLGQTG